MDAHGKGQVNKDKRSKEWNAILLEGLGPGIFSVAYHRIFLEYRTKRKP